MSQRMPDCFRCGDWLSGRWISLQIERLVQHAENTRYNLFQGPLASEGSFFEKRARNPLELWATVSLSRIAFAIGAANRRSERVIASQ
jgi:hypothetical protein